MDWKHFIQNLRVTLCGFTSLLSPVFACGTQGAVTASTWGAVAAQNQPSHSPTSRPVEAASVTIDANTRYQTFDGFGASGAWWHTFVSEFPQEKQREMLELLFTPRGANLVIYRYNLPAGSGPKGNADVVDPMRRTAEVEIAPLTFDLSRDANALNFLREVRNLGVKNFVLFSNSPPPRLTRTGMTSGGEQGNSNLKPGAERDLAQYLVKLATQIQHEYSLPHVTLSPINEPQWKWGEKWRGQEGCHYTPAEAAAVIRAVIDEVRKQKAKMTVEAPESGDWKSAFQYAEAMFADPVIRQELSHFAIHSYWSNAKDKIEATAKFREKFPDKKLAMTEYCEMRHGHDLSIEGGLHLAEVIHDDLTIGDVTTWQWWLAIGPGGYRDALIYASPKTHKVEPTKRLYTLAQYSRHAPPGSVRVAAQTSDPELKSTAFLSPDGTTVALVIINPATRPIEVRLPSIPASATFTDAYHDLAPLASTEARATLPAKSVTTFVFPR